MNSLKQESITVYRLIKQDGWIKTVHSHHWSMEDALRAKAEIEHRLKLLDSYGRYFGNVVFSIDEEFEGYND